MHTFKILVKDKIFTIDHYDIWSGYFKDNGNNVEIETREWFANNLKQEDVIFDIGANAGMYSIIFGNFCKEVYCFEPTFTYEALLVPNLKNNGLDHVKTFKLAIGNKNGIHNDSIYRIWGNEPESLDYDFITIDDFVEQNNVIPNYIKIDVDGFDYEVLLGARNFLINHSPIVCVEVNHALKTRGYNEKILIDYMAELNYSSFQILDNENYFFKKNND